MNKIWKIVANTILVLVIISSLFLIFSSKFSTSINIYSVMSGSMEPKIKTGSLVVVSQKDFYKEGDIVTFKVNSQGATVTHRILSAEYSDGARKFRVKGDANNTPDSDLVLKENIVGKVIFTLPFVGYFFSYLRTLPGLIFFIIIPATIIVYEEINKIKNEIKKIGKKAARVEKKTLEGIIREEKKLARFVDNIKSGKKSSDSGDSDE